MNTNEQPTPEVGMGVTERIGSDCYPYTLIQIINPKTIVIQSDDYKCTDYKFQNYDITPNPDGGKITLTLRKNGRWKRKNATIKDSFNYGLGHRRAYQDPHY